LDPPDSPPPTELLRLNNVLAVVRIVFGHPVSPSCSD
jgi:hypothetical protein